MTETGPIERHPTGIKGFDQAALGGLPAGRPSLLTGTTGSGKTLFAVEFLARGIQMFGEPGVFVTFEETPGDLRRNFASLDFPIAQWESEAKWAFVDASADIGEAPVVGSYDFGALVARLVDAARRIGARRMSLDSLDAVFTRFGQTPVVRQELHRIGRALAELGITAVVTGERTLEHGPVSRYGVEEFVLDNVMILRNVLASERRRRTIEIVKFRGAPHRTGEWLFTIDPRDGLVVIPLAFLTSPPAPASEIRVSAGNADLDEMCGGGVFKDSVVLLTGPNGAGKTLAGLKFLAAGIAAGERCLAFAFDESREQLRRNAVGWGIDLDAAEDSGLVHVVCDLPEVASLEDHFLRIRRVVAEFAPDRLVIDSVSALERIASPRALLDFLMTLAAVVRQHGITTLLTWAPSGRLRPQLAPSISSEIASLADVTISISYFESGGEIRRAIAVVQARGTAHDYSVRQLTVDSDGMQIGEPVADAAHVLPEATSMTVSGGSAIPRGHEERSSPDG
jgi:circadian clock protein KaiC